MAAQGQQMLAIPRDDQIGARCDSGGNDLIARILVDVLSDGLSLVYSFYEPSLSKRSLGSFIILDHILQVLYLIGTL